MQSSSAFDHWIAAGELGEGMTWLSQSRSLRIGSTGRPGAGRDPRLSRPRNRKSTWIPGLAEPALSDVEGLARACPERMTHPFPIAATLRVWLSF
jgi:hypothetical protein